jgi:tetratricopeptide (TPR) repeat protein
MRRSPPRSTSPARLAGRWRCGRTAVAAAEVALESDWFAGTTLAAGRLAVADRAGERGWDLELLRLRHDYLRQVTGAGGPDHRLRERAGELAEKATDDVRRGWAWMYLGLITDNVLGEREAAPAHYAAALRAGEAGDDLLTREALRHLGDHDRDRGDLASARARWERATELGARHGLVCGTLSQQLLLAELARETGDEAGATRLAAEIARWAAAAGATRLTGQARAFLTALS